MRTYAKRIQGLARGMVVFDSTDHHVTDAPGGGHPRRRCCSDALAACMCSVGTGGCNQPHKGTGCLTSSIMCWLPVRVCFRINTH